MLGDHPVVQPLTRSVVAAAGAQPEVGPDSRPPVGAGVHPGGVGRRPFPGIRS